MRKDFLLHSFISKGGMDIVELNEMCRFLLYTPGQKFPAHRDGCFVRPANAGEKGKEKDCTIIISKTYTLLLSTYTN